MELNASVKSASNVSHRFGAFGLYPNSFAARSGWHLELLANMYKPSSGYPYSDKVLPITSSDTSFGSAEGMVPFAYRILPVAVAMSICEASCEVAKK